jgi:hypothetical protein
MNSNFFSCFSCTGSVCISAQLTEIYALLSFDCRKAGKSWLATLRPWRKRSPERNKHFGEFWVVLSSCGKKISNGRTLCLSTAHVCYISVYKGSFVMLCSNIVVQIYRTTSLFILCLPLAHITYIHITYKIHKLRQIACNLYPPRKS